MEEKKQLFYIHGGSAFSDYSAYIKYLKTVPVEPPTTDEERPKRWADSLREDLGEGWEVLKPTMPNSKNAHYQEWKIWFERHFTFLRDQVVLVGWSQGAMFLAKYLIENNVPFNVAALFLLAPPMGRELHRDVDYYGEDGGDFVFDTKEVGKLAKKAEKVFILHSEDDPVVPFLHAKNYHDAIPGSVLLSFQNRNHFLIEEFPELIERIKTL